MKDLRSKKAIAASLSLTLALGSVPAVALADNADENGEGTTSEQSSQAEFVFSANGGQFADGSNSASVMGNEGGSVDAPTPTRAGYTFKGWYSLTSMDGIPEDYQQYYKLDPSSAKAGSWFAAWEKNAEAQAQSVEVVSFFQGGERDGSSVTTTIDVTADSSVADCVKSFEGYTPTKVVSGAATSEEEVNMTSSLEGITALYVYYKADEQKTEQSQINVLYAANGGQFVDGSETMRGVADSDGVMRQPAEPTREGYTFDGWYWHDDYSGYTDEQKAADKVDFSQPVQSDVNIYAQWTKNADVQAEQVTVKFVDNFNETESSTEVKKGEAVAKPADPTYDGWTFEGWSSTLKDDEGNWEYTPVDFSKAVEDEDQDGVVTYYAFYSENQAAADNTANGEEAAGQEAAGDDANAAGDDADESSIAPQTGDATNVAAVAGIGGIAGLLAAAAALLRRRRNN